MHLAPSHGRSLGPWAARPSALSAAPLRRRTAPRAQRTARAAGLCALVVGGTGRVGGSSSRWLKKLAKENQMDLELSVGGRRCDMVDELWNTVMDRIRDTTPGKGINRKGHILPKGRSMLVYPRLEHIGIRW